MDMPETPPQGGIKELSRPHAIATPLAPLDEEERQLLFEFLSQVRAPHPIAKAEYALHIFVLSALTPGS